MTRTAVPRSPSCAPGPGAAARCTAAEYVVDGASAWKGQHCDQPAEALAGARTGGYDVLLVWALDRLSRDRVEATSAYCAGFHAAGAPVWSLREP